MCLCVCACLCVRVCAIFWACPRGVLVNVALLLKWHIGTVISKLMISNFSRATTFSFGLISLQKE